MGSRSSAARTPICRRPGRWPIGRRIGRPAAAAAASVPAFADHRELLRQVAPDALAIFTPHLSHYRLAMDALQAGCHVFIEKPLSTNVQEAADIVSLARGRNLKVGVGHQFRLCPSLVEARRRLAAGAIGPVRLVTAILARPWLTTLASEESTWRFNPRRSGSGILADAGDHLVDALLWTTGQVAQEVGAVQSRTDPGDRPGHRRRHPAGGRNPGHAGDLGHFARDTVCARILRRAGPAPRHRPDPGGRTIRQTAAQTVPLPAPSQTIDGNFVAAIAERLALCCPADQALDTVRLLEAIARSAATGQVVRLI